MSEKYSVELKKKETLIAQAGNLLKSAVVGLVKLPFKTADLLTGKNKKRTATPS